MNTYIVSPDLLTATGKATIHPPYNWEEYLRSLPVIHLSPELQKLVKANDELVEGKDITVGYEVRRSNGEWQECGLSSYEMYADHTRRLVAIPIAATPIEGEKEEDDLYDAVMNYRRDHPTPPSPAIPVASEKGAGKGNMFYTDTEFPGLKVRMDGIREFLSDLGYKDKELDKLLKGIGYWFCHRYTAMSAASPSYKEVEEVERLKGLIRVAFDKSNMWIGKAKEVVWEEFKTENNL
jgi:hypothetical protein